MELGTAEGSLVGCPGNVGPAEGFDDGFDEGTVDGNLDGDLEGKPVG